MRQMQLQQEQAVKETFKQKTFIKNKLLIPQVLIYMI